MMVFDNSSIPHITGDEQPEDGYWLWVGEWVFMIDRWSTQKERFLVGMFDAAEKRQTEETKIRKE